MKNEYDVTRYYYIYTHISSNISIYENSRVILLNNTSLIKYCTRMCVYKNIGLIVRDELFLIVPSNFIIHCMHLFYAIHSIQVRREKR